MTAAYAAHVTAARLTAKGMKVQYHGEHGFAEGVTVAAACVPMGTVMIRLTEVHTGRVQVGECLKVSTSDVTAA